MSDCAARNNHAMIIPVRCFTCGKVIGDKWELFIEYARDMPESSVPSPAVHSSNLAF